MPLGRSVARFNRRVTNHITRPLAHRLPGFGVVTHTGRKTGRTYRTPVNVFPAPDGYVMALTYGARAEWVRNVLAAGGCDLETRGHRTHLTAPEVVRDTGRGQVPVYVRGVLRILGVTEFLRLRTG